MSRFAKIMIALLAITLFAAPAFAADNFSISGNLYEYGFYTDDDSTSTDTFVYQKLRIYGIFKANENVSVQFRTDMTEGKWGADGNSGRKPGNGALGTDMTSLDRAFADINFDTVKLRVGQQYLGFGSTQALSYNDFGATVTIKGEMPVTLTYALLDDNDTAADRFLAGASVKVAGFDVYAGVDQDQAKEVYLLGANYKAKYDGGIAVNAELNFFTGDASATADAEGLTAFVDASLAVTEAATVGGALYYAAGNDDADVAYTLIGNKFGTWDAFTRGPFADESYLMVSRPFDIFGAERGVIAGQVYADFKASDDLMVGGSLAYAEPETDTTTTEDSKVIFSAYTTYALIANVDWYNGVQYVSTDDSNPAATDSELSIASGLNIKF
jgi:hypothetical protein